ncbi:MAG TPA: FkbM family methyltransferase [Nakamurella sp.]
MATTTSAGSPHPRPRPARETARFYDQHLRLFAAHFSNMWDGRANSAALVADYFHELISLIRPELFVEAGAYRAEASRRVRADNPDCRVVAFEANPYNHQRFAEELGFAAAGIDYLNLAITETTGPVTFHLRTRQDGEDLRRVTGNSSLLRRAGTGTDYEEITVDGASLDNQFAGGAASPVCLWIDVEGASAQVLRGARRLLERTELVLIEVEEKLMWESQWRSLDVIEFFLDAGFVPLTRDAEYNQQYNIMFVRGDVYERPEVLWSHELHTNFVTQHMGVIDQQSRGNVQDSAPVRRWWRPREGAAAE